MKKTNWKYLIALQKQLWMLWWSTRWTWPVDIALFLPEKCRRAGETSQKSNNYKQNLENIFSEEGLKGIRLLNLRKRRMVCIPLYVWYVDHHHYTRNNYFIEGSVISYGHSGQKHMMKQRRLRRLVKTFLRLTVMKYQSSLPGERLGRVHYWSF